MSLIQTLEADFKKIIAFIPFIDITAAIADPVDAASIKATVAALQPVISTVQAASGGVLSHSELVSGVIDAVTKSSAELATIGVLDATTAEHIVAITPIIHAAVAMSGMGKSA
jgi:hypothetical protein